MKINNYNELIKYLDKDSSVEKNILMNNKNIDYNMFEYDNGSKIIIDQDKEGICTSFPNEELIRDKFVIRRKLRYCAIKEHKHEYIEIVYVLKGEFIQSIRGQKYKMEKGDFCIYDQDTYGIRYVSN